MRTGRNGLREFHAATSWDARPAPDGRARRAATLRRPGPLSRTRRSCASRTRVRRHAIEPVRRTSPSSINWRRERFWPNEDPIGKRVWFGGGSTFDRPDSSAEIVGIVGDVAYQSLDQHPFQPDFYTPYAQFTYATRTVLVRTRQDPNATVADIRRAVASVDPGLALFDVRAMDDLIGDSWARLSYQTKILTAFAVVALLLAATGIFAIVAHMINDRRRELGVRVALGASPAQVLATVGEAGVKPAAVGLAAGVVATVFLARALAATVYGVRAFDPLVLGAVASLLALVIVLSALLAGRRALAIDPVDALKLE